MEDVCAQPADGPERSTIRQDRRSKAVALPEPGLLRRSSFRTRDNFSPGPVSEPQFDAENSPVLLMTCEWHALSTELPISTS